MRIVGIGLVIAIAVALGAAPAVAQSTEASLTASSPGDSPTAIADDAPTVAYPTRPVAQGLTPQQVDSARRAFILFVITVIVLVLLLVALIISSIALRRRVRSLEKEEKRVASQIEDLFWRNQAPRPEKKDTPE